jgi:prophage regulatory protein
MTNTGKTMTYLTSESRSSAQKPCSYSKLIRIKTVCEMTGISKSYVYQLMGLGQFPRSLQIIPGGRCIAWDHKEILDWIDSRIASKNKEASHEQ